MRHIFTLLIPTLLSFSMLAQSKISIQINHLLDGVEFGYDNASKNDLDHDFKFSRLEYYLSNFEIIHDGGQVTLIDDSYALINLGDSKSYSLIDIGSVEATSIESINFMFGVDEVANHSDPALHDADHPLAPKFPSMHWGWAGGYRFIAIEGKSGPNLDQTMEFHCIGDEFYKKISFPVAMSGADEYTLNINADYVNLMKSITLDMGVILHGNLGAIKVLAENLISNVFTEATPSSVSDNEAIEVFNVYPNPTTIGVINLDIEVLTEGSTIELVNIYGQIIDTANVVKNNQFKIDSPGMYLANIRSASGNILATRKIIVN